MGLSLAVVVLHSWVRHFTLAVPLSTQPLSSQEYWYQRQNAGGEPPAFFLLTSHPVGVSNILVASELCVDLLIH